MGLRINTNTASIRAQRVLDINTRKKADTLARLSSGTRIIRSSDDAAGLAISEKLKAHIRGLRQNDRNANDAISMLQVAEGSLSEISNILVRMRELSIQSSSDTINDKERKFTDLEYQSLKKEIERISQVTAFNGKNLLNGRGGLYEFQIGLHNNSFQDRIQFNMKDLNSSLKFLDLDDREISRKKDAQNGLLILDGAIETISGQRALIGAKQNRLTSNINNIQTNIENLSNANSRIRDTDYAKEMANNTKFNILTSAGISILAQANMNGQMALKLIG